MKEIPKLSMKMIAHDSRWGPSLHAAKSQEQKDWVCDSAQAEWDRLHSDRSGIPCTIITAFGTYQS